MPSLHFKSTDYDVGGGHQQISVCITACCCCYKLFVQIDADAVHTCLVLYRALDLPSFVVCYCVLNYYTVYGKCLCCGQTVTHNLNVHRNGINIGIGRSSGGSRISMEPPFWLHEPSTKKY